MDDAEIEHRFPRSAKYAFEWVKEGAMGSHVLWLTEWLSQQVDLKPGMRVLDLGCGRAKSSIFLAREFDVEVWATDLWIAASENWRRVRDADLDGRVFPLHADARALPFAADYFDAIIAVDCYSYFGTDDLYLNYLAQFVKPGGPIGIAGAGLVHEIEGLPPEHVRGEWTQDFWCLHSLEWWQRHWERTGILEITAADTLADAWQLWARWQRQAWPHNTGEIEMIERDAGRTFTYFRLVGRRREGAPLVDYCWPDTMRAMPWHYEKQVMLRNAE